MSLITRFCGTRDSREWMRKPVRANGFLFATNGHIAIRMPDDPAIEAGSEMPQKIFDLFEKTYSQDLVWTAIPLVPKDKVCRFCNGSGRVVECPDCDGEGNFDHGHHEYECRHCQGSGGFPAKASDGVHCDECFGTGHYWREYLDIEAARYAKHYLALIADCFPGAGIGIPSDPMAATAWKRGDVRRLLMPMRKD